MVKTIKNDANKEGDIVAKRRKITNVPLILKICNVIFCILAKQIINHFLGFFEGASTFL
jgi:hypothetical protein